MLAELTRSFTVAARLATSPSASSHPFVCNVAVFKNTEVEEEEEEES